MWSRKAFHRRSLGLTLGLLGFTLLHAQDNAKRDVTISFQPALTSAQAKVTQEVLHAMDPQGRISFSNDLTVCKYHFTTGATNAQLLGALQEEGVSGTIAPTSAGTGSNTRQSAPQGMPHYVDTGDPIMDEARYKAEKEAWVEAHPELYQQFLDDLARPSLSEPENK